MAQEPPRRDEPTIFEVTEYDWYPAHNEDENLYPKLNISSSRVGFGRTLEEAEELMRHAVEKAEEKSNDIYCFHIKEFPIFCKVFQRRRCPHIDASQFKINRDIDFALTTAWNGEIDHFTLLSSGEIEYTSA